MKISPLFYLLWAVTLGILTFPLFNRYFNFPACSYLIFSLFFLLLSLLLKRESLVFSFFAFFFLAQLSCSLYTPVSFLAFPKKSFSFEGVVRRVYENSLQVEVDVFGGKRVTGDVRLVGVKASEGERIFLKGVVLKASLFKPPLVYASQKKTISPPPPWERYLSLIRYKIGSNLRRDLPPEEKALISGVLWGERKEIPPYLAELFMETGTGHLLAVSGLHVGVIFLIFFSLFSLLRFPLYPRFFLSLLPTFLYVALAGFTPSVIRAFFMLFLGMGGWLYGGRRALISTLSLSALFLLIWNPSYLFNISFELSYLSVMGIALLSPLLEDIFLIFPLSFRKALAATLSAQIFTFPLVVKEFGIVSLVSPLVNLMVIPLLFPLLLFSLLLSSLYFLPFSFYQIVLPFTHLVAFFMLKIISLLSSLPFAHLALSSLPSLSIWFSLLCFLIILKNKIKISLKSLIFITILFLILAFFYPVFDSPFKIIFFDVGEGDATFISSEGGGILIDGGPSPYLLRKKLRKFNIRKVDYIVLSHPHEDHIAGLSLFYQDPRVKKVITAPYPDSLKWEELKRCFGRRVDEINSEKEYKLGNLVMRFKFVNVPGEESNDEQLILKVKYRDLNILFTGDAGRGVQEELMKEKWIASHILKVPHHGSSDFEPKFIHKVAPFLAIISVGRKNRYHHPSSKVLTELRGVKIFRTDKNGDILLEGEKGRIRVFTSN